MHMQHNEYKHVTCPTVERLHNQQVLRLLIKWTDTDNEHQAGRQLWQRNVVIQSTGVRMIEGLQLCILVTFHRILECYGGGIIGCYPKISWQAVPHPCNSIRKEVEISFAFHQIRDNCASVSASVSHREQSQDFIAVIPTQGLVGKTNVKYFPSETQWQQIANSKPVDIIILPIVAVPLHSSTLHRFQELDVCCGEGGQVFLHTA